MHDQNETEMLQLLSNIDSKLSYMIECMERMVVAETMRNSRFETFQNRGNSGVDSTSE